MMNKNSKYNRNKKYNELKKKNKILVISLCLCISVLIFITSFIVIKFNKRINELNGKINEVHYRVIYKENSCNYSSRTKLHLASSYGNDEGTHPKVLYFNNGFAGYKYWMAYTPYPKGKDMYENPNILVSNDGVEWVEKEGFTNPLEDVPSNYKKSVIYNSDTHLVYNSDTNLLECWWRYVNDEDGVVIIYRKTTSDGVKWSDKEEVIKQIRKKVDYLSPAVIYEDEQYKLWYVDRDLSIRYTKSNDLKEWSNPVKINVNYYDKDIRNWHLDVIHDEDEYIMVVSAFVKNFARTRMNLYYAKSENETGFSNAKLLLTPSFATDGWDNKGIYRSSIVRVNNKYYLYYSGIKSNEERGIGLIKLDSLDEARY